MSPRARRWLANGVRLLVTSVAVAYVYQRVDWYDRAYLAESPQRAYRVLSPPGEWPLRLDDPRTGEQRTARADDLASTEAMAAYRKRPIEQGLRDVVRRLDARYALLGVFALAPVTFLLAIRLRDLLEMQAVPLSLREAIWLTFAGNFFNFALPGTTGGDLYKAYHIARIGHKRTEGVTVVFLDRAFGMVAFVLLAGPCVLLSWRVAAIGRLGKFVGVLLAALVIGSLVFFSRRFRRWIHYDQLLARLPMADRLRRVDQTVFACRLHPWRTARAMILTFMSHLLLAAGVMYVSRAVGMPQATLTRLDWTYFDFYVSCTLALSVGYLVAAVPLSIQGFGLLEAVFLRVLAGPWGTSSQVLAVCLGFRMLQLLWSLPGMIAPWRGLSRPPAAADSSGAASAENESP